MAQLLINILYADTGHTSVSWSIQKLFFSRSESSGSSLPDTMLTQSSYCVLSLGQRAGENAAEREEVFAQDKTASCWKR